MPRSAAARLEQLERQRLADPETLEFWDQDADGFWVSDSAPGARLTLDDVDARRGQIVTFHDVDGMLP